MVKKRSNCIDHIYSEKRKSCQLCQSDASKKNPINYAKTWSNLMKGAPPSNHFKTIRQSKKNSQFLILQVAPINLADHICVFLRHLN